MVVGERSEDKLSKIERHIKEIEEDTISWYEELSRAIRWNDKNHMENCMWWLEILGNTLAHLRK